VRIAEAISMTRRPPRSGTALGSSSLRVWRVHRRGVWSTAA